MKRRPAGDKQADRRIWTRRVLARYWLLQVPGTLLLLLILFALQDRFAIPLWMLVSIIVVWVVKDAALYPLLWRSYDSGRPTAHTMVGRRGVAVERIDPTGNVRVRGELWRAELVSDAAPIDAGEHVLVETTRNLTLLVRRPDASSHARDPGA